MLQETLFSEIKDRNLIEKAAADGLAYLNMVFDRHVYPESSALEALLFFEEDLPVQSTPAAKVLDQLHTLGTPATVAQTGGRYFGFVNGSVIPAGLAARILTDFWDQNTAMQVLSPVAAKLEQVVQGWLKTLFGLPSSSVAGFVSGTSMATFCGLAAARYRILKRRGWDVNDRGMSGAPVIRIVAGRQAHSTVLKAICLLGFGKEGIEWVECDKQGRILNEALPALDQNTILILQAGNVNTGSFDDFNFLCSKAQAAGAWVHIDGAFGLWAAAAEKLKHLTKGIELADSWGADGHKTLNTPYDNGIIMCRDAEALVSALHMTGAYIVKGNDRDGMDYTPEMSRRARIFELWATLKSLGTEGLDEMVSNFHVRAKQFSEGLKAEGFEIINEVVFNQVLVHYKNNEHTKALLKKVQDQRTCWCGGSSWENMDVIRISVCSWATTENDIALSVDSFINAREMVEAEMSSD